MMPSQRGQTLLSFCIALPVALVAVGGVLFLGLLLATKIALQADTYYLARAHLYSHDQSRCAPARFWRELGYARQLNFKFECSGKGRVRGEILWRDQAYVHTETNLEPRSDHT